MSFTAAAVTEDLPITGLCIVEQTSPTGYIMIDKCQDNPKAEADLWKDSIFSRKVKRFLCVTRVFPLDSGRLNNVLADIAVIDEKDAVAPGYSKIPTTQDTGEQALKKRSLCVRMVPREQAENGINDIIFLCKTRRPPPGYTLAGDLSGLMLCYRIAPVPKATNPPLPPRPTPATSTHLPYPMPDPQQPTTSVGMQGAGNATMYMNNHQHRSINVQQQQAGPDRQLSRTHPLSGVPFEINPRFVSDVDQLMGGMVQWQPKDHLLKSFDYTYQTEEQAMNTYNYYNESKLTAG